MGRKTATIVIDRGSAETNRDHGKTFFLTEMPAHAAERWATRALLALGRKMPDLPDDAAQLGLLGLARFGISAFLSMDFDEATVLLDQMMTCVKFVPDPVRSMATFSPLALEADVEEVSTLLRLRDEVFKLHTGFSLAASLSTSDLAASVASLSTTTSTSPAPSA